MEGSRPQFELASRVCDIGRVVAVSGEVDMATAGLLADALDPEEGTTLLDISGLTFIDSAGLHALAFAQAAAGLVGGTLRLQGEMAPAVARAIELSGAALSPAA